MTWPNIDLLRRLGIALPVIQAPMAGAQDEGLAIAVAKAGGLGSLPCAMLTAEQVRAQMARVRAATDRGINLNFFCHQTPPVDDMLMARWQARLQSYYDELGVQPAPMTGGRAPFDENWCALVEELRPRVVSFHFGLPRAELLERVRRAGCFTLSSATTVAEARWLADKGVDAIIAQGVEAGGHRGMFLSDDLATQVGLFALLPQIVDAVTVPVIAAGGIADARAVAAAFTLGASAVQIGTAYLHCPEATILPMHRAALRASTAEASVLTNVITGRPARSLLTRLVREVGPVSADAPPFPLAAAAVMPLRAKAEAAGSGDFSPLWSGQAGAMAHSQNAGEFTHGLANQVLSLLQ